MPESKKGIVILVFLIILVSLYLGFQIGEMQRLCKVCPPSEIDFSLFWEAYYKLQEKFTDKTKINAQKIIYGAISGMTKSLEDPYTVFFDPEETKKFKEDISGKFEGVGMEIGIRENQLTVIAPLKDTPAEKAGLLSGDKILKIDDVFSADITIDKAVMLIRGPKGTEVVLTILREGWESSKEFKIIRAVIEIPSLDWELKEGNIAYLKLYHFSEKAKKDFKEAAKEILISPAKKIILDLRNNPGGYLKVSEDICGWFLEKGQVVVIEEKGQERTEHKAGGPAKLSKYPIVILINQGSASASEILAGALRDNREVILIGENSFGKGSVQEAINLSEGSSLKITVANWLTPNGKLITDKGLEPDIEIKMTEIDYQEGKDPQLEKAIEVIKELK